MTEQPAPLAQLIHHLHAQGRLRVWSVIVTILGELAEPEGGRDFDVCASGALRRA